MLLPSRYQVSSSRDPTVAAAGVLPAAGARSPVHPGPDGPGSPGSPGSPGTGLGDLEVVAATVHFVTKRLNRDGIAALSLLVPVRTRPARAPDHRCGHKQTCAVRRGEDVQVLDAVRLAVEGLKGAGVRLAPGLSDAQVRAVEQRWGFRFAQDHRELLQAVLPLGAGWVDWRSERPEVLEQVRERLAWPVQGVLMHVEDGHFWPASWGPRPGSTDEALGVAATELSRWPVLVPVYGHRYMAAEPVGAGGPVFSVHQSDVIHYGQDLVDYLRQDRLAVGLQEWDAVLRPVAPWSSMALGVEDDQL